MVIYYKIQCLKITFPLTNKIFMTVEIAILTIDNV